MALLKEQIPNLINGVSQQPPPQRLSSQCQEQDNYIISLAQGLKKRPPLEYVSKINGRTDDTVFAHTIDRDKTQRFNAQIYSSQFTSDFSTAFSQAVMQVTDLLDGSNVTVNGFSGDIKTYLTLNNPRDNLRMVTVADFTFILNKTVTAAKTSTLGSTRGAEGLIFLKQASSATDMKVFVNGAEVANVTGSNDAETMVDELFSDLETSLGSAGPGTYTITKFEQSNVHITRVNGADFTLHAQAPIVNMVAIKDTINDFTDLPDRTKDGFQIKVTGDPGTRDDDYYLKMVNSGDVDFGEWEETVKPGLANTIDPATMPIQLIRNGSEFDLSQVAWDLRQVGDTNTAPDPTFIGQKINDIFFYKNRLGLLAGENLILSELGEFFNYYSVTGTQLLATDLIDLAAPSNDVNILHSAVPFDEKLFVYSDRAQFTLKESTADGLTPKVAVLEPSTEFRNSALVHPVVIGTKLYFTETKDGFSSIEEFGLVEDFSAETAEEVTGHVPNYIIGDITKLVGAKSDNLLFAISNSNVNEIYVYKFLFQKGIKQLASWGKWKLPEDEAFIDIGVIASILYFLIKRPDGTYLEKLSLQTGNLTNITPDDDNLIFKVMLDRLTTITGVYSSSTGLTTFTLPYSDINTTFKFVKGPAFGAEKGSLIQNLTQVSGDSYTVSGNLSAGFVWVGTSYLSRYEFTQPTVKVIVDNKRSAVVAERLAVKKFGVNYFETPFFDMKITSPARDDTIYTFDRITGAPDNIIGEITFGTGKHVKTVMRNSQDLVITLENDGYFPSTFTNAEWTADIINRVQPRRLQ